MALAEHTVGRTRLLAEHIVGRTRLLAEPTVGRIVFRAMSDLNRRQQRHNMSSAIYHQHNRIAALQERHNINTGNGCAAIAQVPQYLAENYKRAGVIAVRPSCLHVRQYGNDHCRDCPVSRCVELLIVVLTLDSYLSLCRLVLAY